jgi:hypothetical protein
MGNYWSEIADYYKALTPTFLKDAYEKTLAESLAMPQEQIQMVNPYTLLVIGMLEGALLLRKFADPTSTSRGWENEANAFLSTASIYGPPVGMSSLQKAK